MAKKAETASSTMDFYQTSLRKFVQFLGQRADEPIGEITKQDVVAFRHSLVGQVSAKTVNHDLKALKMLFKSARRDSAITDDPTEFVESVRKERGIKIKRPFTLPELRSVLRIPCSARVLCLPDSSRSLCRRRDWQAGLERRTY
jgi:site-specific recombinase XerD